MPELSVAENIFLGRLPVRKGFGRRMIIDWREVERKQRRHWPASSFTWTFARKRDAWAWRNNRWLRSPRRCRTIRRADAGRAYLRSCPP